MDMATDQSRDLTDTQWAAVGALMPEPPRRKDGRGRPWKDRRAVLNGVLWVLRTGAPWAELPDSYPSYQTCHRRFQQWVRSGILRGMLEALAEDLHVQGRLDIREAFIDGSFAPAKKGALRLEKRSVVKGQRSWQLRTDQDCLSLCT
jgi:transposase